MAQVKSQHWAAKEATVFCKHGGKHTLQYAFPCVSGTCVDTRVSSAHVTGSEKTFPVGPAGETDEPGDASGVESQLLLEDRVLQAWRSIRVQQAPSLL